MGDTIPRFFLFVAAYKCAGCFRSDGQLDSGSFGIARIEEDWIEKLIASRVSENSGNFANCFAIDFTYVSKTVVIRSRPILSAFSFANHSREDDERYIFNEIEISKIHFC